jgi:quinol-cytochrome oxidoreductase complex cytochrome b subunit
MPYELWKVVHLAGVIALFASLGGLAALSLVARPESSKPFKVLHGVALGLIFLAGFGLLAKLGFGSPGSWGAWVWIKLGVWLVLGGALAFVRKAGRNATAVLLLCALLGAVAAWAAVTKPGM